MAHSYLSNAAVQCPMLTATVTASDLIDHTIALRAVRDCLNSTGEVADLDSQFRFINWRFHQLANVLISSLSGRTLSNLERTIRFCFLTFLREDQLRIVDEMVSVQSKEGRGRDIDANQFLDLLQCFTCELDLQQSGVETETVAKQFHFLTLGTILGFSQNLRKIDLSQLPKRIKRSRKGRFHLFRFLKVGVSVYDFAWTVGHFDLASKLLSGVYDSFFDNLKDHFSSALCKSPNDLAWVHNWTLCSTLSVLRGSISKTTMDLWGNFDVEDALRKSLLIFEKLILTISTCSNFVNWQLQMHNSTTCGTLSDFALLHNQRLLIIGEEWQCQTMEMDSLFEGLPSLILEVIAELCFFLGRSAIGEIVSVISKLNSMCDLASIPQKFASPVIRKTAAIIQDELNKPAGIMGKREVYLIYKEVKDVHSTSEIGNAANQLKHISVEQFMMRLFPGWKDGARISCTRITALLVIKFCDVMRQIHTEAKNCSEAEIYLKEAMKCVYQSHSNCFIWKARLHVEYAKLLARMERWREGAEQAKTAEKLMKSNFGENYSDWIPLTPECHFEKICKSLNDDKVSCPGLG